LSYGDCSIHKAMLCSLQTDCLYSPEALSKLPETSACRDCGDCELPIDGVGR
jgi:hypothetical protein